MTPTPHDTPKAPDKDFEAAVEFAMKAAVDWGTARYSSAVSHDRKQALHETATTARQALLARYEAMRVRQEWQPIETAPKDGTAILLTGGVYGGMPFAGAWVPHEFCPDRPWINAISASRLYEWVPKKWMPLPPGSEFEARSTLHATEREGRS